jgi:protein-disulfide isomerase
MSNRQARRDQSRQARSARAARPGRPAPGRGAPKRTGGGRDLFSLPYLLGVGGLIVILAVVLIVVATRSGGSSDGELTKLLEDAKAGFPTDMVNGGVVGSDSAPIKLDEYEDFQCPFCLKYTANQEPTLIEEYVKTGKVQLRYKHYTPIGGESVKAALATSCAGDQGKFWDYKHKLFLVQAQAGQDTDERINVGRFSDSNLEKYAGELGLDTAAFSSCLNSDKHLQTLQDHERDAKALGIRGTPSFAINGAPLGQSGAPGSIEDWRKILDAVYAEVTGTPTATAGTPQATPAR